MRPERPEVRVVGRVTSHFTRVVTMLAHELDVPFVLDPVDDLLATAPSVYGENPGLKLPTLRVDGAPTFGAEPSCRALAELAGRADDPRVVLAHHPTARLVRNAHEVAWQAMSTQVQLVVGVRLAGLPAESPYFAKAAASLTGALAWLDENLAAVRAALPADRQVSVLELAVYCLLEHLAFRPSVPFAHLSALAAFVADHGARPSAQRTPYRPRAR